ncbi:MAG: DUF2975 domain-containing protein [Chitinophagaceae bacterium]|nr:DUF2975 domain-containing protein [Chitinophagaceae bacterium]
MSKRNNFIWIGLNVISWIIFVGLCIQAGGLITNTVATLILTPSGATKFWKEVDLSAVYNHNQSYFVMLSVLLVIVTILKVILFYFILKIFHDKKLDLLKPFNETIKRFILGMAYLALGIGFFASWGTTIVDNLAGQGIKIPGLNNLKIAGADVWLFMGVSLLIIGFTFKRGIELQNESDLTV